MKALCALSALFLLAGPTDSSGATAARKKKAPAAPAFSQSALDEIQERAANGPGALENTAALVPFFEQILHPIEGGNIHILQYGDSHTASDDWANGMRLAFQAKFGMGGPGFFLAGRPFRGYRRIDVESYNNSLGWETDGTTGRPGDGHLGLGGVSITARRPNETVTVEAESDTLQLYYLIQPGGGDFVISGDGGAPQSVSTDGELAAGYLQLDVRPGLHRFTLRTTTAKPVRLFGWAADKQAGISYETLGINGAQAPMILDWNEPVLVSNMTNRKPALMILEYGTNESLNPRFTVEDYTREFAEVLAKMRRAAPLASILVVGPPDCLKTLRPLPHIEDVIRIERTAAARAGCAFWDWRARMGGVGSVKQWARAGLGQPDFIHLTTPGYRLTASMLFRDLMQQYDRFVAVRSE